MKYSFYFIVCTLFLLIISFSYNLKVNPQNILAYDIVALSQNARPSDLIINMSKNEIFGSYSFNGQTDRFRYLRNGENKVCIESINDPGYFLGGEEVGACKENSLGCARFSIVKGISGTCNENNSLDIMKGDPNLVILEKGIFALWISPTRGLTSLPWKETNLTILTDVAGIDVVQCGFYTNKECWKSQKEYEKAKEESSKYYNNTLQIQNSTDFLKVRGIVYDISRMSQLSTRYLISQNFVITFTHESKSFKATFPEGDVYEVHIPSGSYKISVKSMSYIYTEKEATYNKSSDENTDENTLYVSELPLAWRISLSWQDDQELYAYLIDNTSGKVYTYKNHMTSKNQNILLYAHLKCANIEEIGIKDSLKSGAFSYYIHDYTASTNSKRNFSTTYAKVRLYHRETVVGDFLIKKDNPKNFSWFHLLDIDTEKDSFKLVENFEPSISITKK